LYISVVNNGSDEFSIYKYSSTITQNARQYEHQSNYHADYPELTDNLLPGNVTDGVITFPRLEFDDIKVILKATSYNYKEKLKPFEFEVHVEDESEPMAKESTSDAAVE